MEERPIEVRTEHGCVLDVLTRRLAEANVDDTAALANEALRALLRDGAFDRCCLPKYLALAPERGQREIQIPIATHGAIETRVLVWPIGAGDSAHPHVDGWTVFVPVAGDLVTVEQSPTDGTNATRLAPREPVVLRPEDRIRHRVRNAAPEPAVTIHISG
jgi:hypothetical protein